MNEYLLTILTKYRRKGILIDTNILLLYLVGSYEISLIEKFSRTANFTIEDFYRTSKFIDFFERKITTPHILTEVNNLFGNRTSLNQTLKTFVEITDERFTESIKVIENDAFIKFGLTDSAVLESGKDSYLILTDDRPFYAYLLSKEIDAVSLDQVRMI